MVTVEYAGKLFPVVFREPESFCASRVPLFPLPLFVCFRDDLRGPPSPVFEHIFNEDAVLVTRANEIILFLNNMANGDLHNSNDFSIGGTTTRGVLTPAACVALQNVLHQTKSFILRHGTEEARAFRTSLHADAFPLLPVASGNPSEKRGYTRLRADRVVVPEPGEGGAVPFVDFLPEPMAQLYDEAARGAAAFREPDESDLERFPIIRHCSEEQYRLIIEKMVESGMVELQTEPPKCINGIFGVRKSDVEDRIIIDCRRGNLFLRPSPDVRLPTPTDLADLVFPVSTPEQQRRIVVAKSDISAYYHRLRMPRWMRQIYGLPPLKQRGGLSLYPVCVSLPMGSSHGTSIAHSFHRFTIDEVLEEHELSGEGGAVAQVGEFDDEVMDESNSETAMGAYIDDQFYLALLRRWLQVNSLMTKVNQRLQERGLVISAPKLIFAEEGHGETDVLGMAVCEDGWIFPKAGRVAGLIGDTMKMIASARASVKSLESIVGRWVWNLMLRRPALSILSSVYSLVAADDNEPQTLQSQMRLELLALIIVSPLLSSNLFAPISTLLVATDASLTGAGVCVARVTEGEARAIYARRVRRGWWAAALCDPWGPVDEPEEEQRPRMSPVVRDVVTRNTWSTVISYAFAWREEKIVLLEGWALLAGLKWVAADPRNHGQRIAFFIDSMSLLGAVAKGRSSTRRLNRICRRVAAILLVTGIRPVWVWVESEFNPADAPSRAVGPHP